MDNLSTIIYPYMPEGKSFIYVTDNDPFIVAAKIFAINNSSDKIMPNASVIVKNGKIIGIGANCSDYHEKNECQRVKLKIPTGQGYELCEGCHPKNHSEPTAIRTAISSGHDIAGSSLYLWGHWWCCKPCWELIGQSGIDKVYLLLDSQKLFNKNHPENIVGKQYELFA